MHCTVPNSHVSCQASALLLELAACNAVREIELQMSGLDAQQQKKSAPRIHQNSRLGQEQLDFIARSADKSPIAHCTNDPHDHCMLPDAGSASVALLNGLAASHGRLLQSPHMHTQKQVGQAHFDPIGHLGLAQDTPARLLSSSLLDSPGAQANSACREQALLHGLDGAAHQSLIHLPRVNTVSSVGHCEHVQ